MTNTEKYLVLLGLDEDKKPRAARFDYADETAVRKLAAIKGFQIGHAKSDEAFAVAARLVDGKIFQSGKGLVPLVNTATYEQLLELLQIEDPATEPVPAKSKAAPGKPVTLSVLSPDPWFNISVGSIVLCKDDSPKKKEDWAWWQCSVTGVSKDNKLLTVRYTNFPTFKPFTVKRAAVAILPAKG